MRQVKEFATADGLRFRVRYRSGGTETSETFLRRTDAEMFAGILGDGRAGRVVEALDWLAGKEKAADSATFGQWFETYLSHLSGIQPRTVGDYRAIHRRYLTHLDPLPLTLITRGHVAALVNQLDAQGLAPKTIKNVMHMLSSAMSLALDEGHISRNPVRRVRLPKQKLDQAEVMFLTYEEAGALVDATESHYQPLVMFLLGSGLRWSEATALQARHVSLENGTVRVQRAWKRIPGGWEIGPPKSAKSNRTVNAGVPALVAVAEILRGPNDLVFTTPRGNVVRHANFYNRIWVPACERAGLIDPRPTIHTCRHAFASWLISDGIGLEAVQDQLGHESYETTRKVYAQLLPAVGVAAGRSSSAAMERVLSHRSNGRANLALEAARGADDAADTGDIEAVVNGAGEARQDA